MGQNSIPGTGPAVSSELLAARDSEGPVYGWPDADYICQLTSGSVTQASGGIQLKGPQVAKARLLSRTTVEYLNGNRPMAGTNYLYRRHEYWPVVRQRAWPSQLRGTDERTTH